MRQKLGADSAAQLRTSPLLSPPLFQTCLRLQSLLQMRAGWSAWRPAGWQMERCRRWRGATTAAAAAASGGEARDKDTPTVRAAQRVPVISHCDAASPEYKICNKRSLSDCTIRCCCSTAALSPLGSIVQYSAASSKMRSQSAVIKAEIRR